MAKTIARFMILAKSDRMGKKDAKEEDKSIRYSGILSFDKIDLTQIVKDLSWGSYWSKEDIDVIPQTEYFAVVEVNKDGFPIVKSLMTREEYIASLGI